MSKGALTAPRSVLGYMVGASLLVMASAASAQSTAGGQPATQLEEVIVTASKRAEPVQKVPQTVNVVSASTIADLHVQNTIELTTVVGGLSLTMTSPSEQSISLRGIKMPSGGGPSTNTVETYLNEVPITVIDAFATTLDIGQIEVLKGPQGTLRGRPSPSGALTIATQKGSFTGYDGYAEGTLSDHKGRRVEAAYGGPISDTLAFRVAGIYDHNGLTEVKNIWNGKSNFQETKVARGTLSWAPSDRFNADVMVQYTRQTGDFYRQITGRAPCKGDQGGAILVSSIACGKTFDLKDKIALTEGTNPNSYKGGLVTANARYELTDHLDVNYVGGFNDTKYYTRLDFDFAGIGDANNFARYIDVLTKRRAYSNELRLQSNGNQVYNFIYGVFAQNARTNGVTNLPPLFTGQLNRNTTKDFGVFTTQKFTFSDKDSLQVGLRYSKVEITNRVNGSQRSYNATTGNASYQHQFTPDVMGYVSYGTSFRPGSGGANAAPRPVIPASFGNFEDEHSKSLELGFKTRFFEDRVTANVAYFDQKYDGYITSQFNVACTGAPNPNGLAYGTDNGLQNGPQCFGTMTGNGDAVSKGFELELNAKLTSQWTVGGIFTYTKAHFADAELPCNDYNGDGILDVNGTPMVQKGRYVSLCRSNGPLGSLPKISFSANTNYNFTVGEFPAYVRLNSFTRSSSYFPQTGRTFPGYTIVNGSVGVFNPGREWELSLWVKNILNKVVEDTDGGPWTIFGVPSGLRIGTVTNDREMGATLRRTF